VSLVTHLPTSIVFRPPRLYSWPFYKLGAMNRVPRWLLPAVLALLVLVVVIGAIIR
jgi:hypothetical protein